MSFAARLRHCETIAEIIIECKKLRDTEGASEKDIQTAQNILQMSQDQQETLLQFMQQNRQ